MLAGSAQTQLAKLSIEHSSGRTRSYCIENKLKMHYASCSFQRGVSTILPVEPTADIFDRTYKNKVYQVYYNIHHTASASSLLRIQYMSYTIPRLLLVRHARTALHPYTSIVAQGSFRVSNACLMCFTLHAN